ncbi:uncharacterized protein LOC121777810 [Salvia splendens]|uniref:uncharacterized protein LOC121777810 n=1 Tax=Salvia splendens TaxID=180675 RepID=UPI001C27BB89|nr:uncharacterized protein LOC121777810 [Salvia splendens]
METNRRAKRIPSGDMFSFLVINQDEFEFGSVASPASPNSPADRLFANGKLLPHAFPVQAGNAFSYYSYSRSTSRASSKDYSSLMSSRSNSTNSRTSTSSSARTSTSDASERRPLRARDHHYYGAGRRERAVRSPVVMSCQYQYGASRRWQLIAAEPALKQRGSPSSSAASDQNGAVADRKGANKSKSNWFKRVVTACQECHAIKT